MTVITDATFQKEVLEKSKKMPVVVDFWAPWCQPCKAIGKELVRLAEMRPDVRIVKVNVDERSDLVREYDIKGVPLVMFVKKGSGPQSFTGLLRAEEIIRKFGL